MPIDTSGLTPENVRFLKLVGEVTDDTPVPAEVPPVTTPPADSEESPNGNTATN